MAKVKFNRGLYSKSIVDSLKDGELFFDTNTDTTAAAGNQGIYMGVAQSDGTVKPVKVAIGAKQYMTLIDNTFLRGKELGSNIFMYTDDTDTGLRFAPMVRTGRSGFSLIAGVAGTDNDIFDTTKRAYSLAQIWGGESFGGKITLDGWSEGLKSIKSGEPPDILSFFFPHGFDITSERPGDNTVWDSIVGVYHCKGNYGISNENGRITDVTGLFIDPAKTTNARVGVVINGKTNDDLLTANGSTVSASGFLKNTASAVGTANLSDGAVTTAKIAQEAVTESKIADGAVTKGKLATALQTTIDGAVQGNTLTPILKEIDLTGTDAERKAKLDQFEADWKALTGSDTLEGARFVGKSVVPDDGEPLVGVFSFSSSSYCEGMLYASAYTPYKAELTIDGSLTITPLFQHLEAVTIKTSNSDTDKAANVAAIKAYVNNLKSLGVDITKGYMIPINLSQYAGFIAFTGEPTTNGGFGVCRTSTVSVGVRLATDGSIFITTILDNINTYSTLTTTSKQIIGAINEVNAAVKTKAANIKDASSTGGINQAFDGGETLDVTGKNPNATALDSTITGALTRGATGQYASSFGGKSIAMGKRSFAEGTTTIAKGNYSHAEGDNSVALGSDSHVEGYQTTTGPSAMGAHAEGNGTQSLGAASHSEGSSTIAKGNTSHAEGADTKANGVASHAEGNGTKGDGNYSHAEGNGTSAIGSSSHAEGYITIAQGDMSHAEGALTKAIGSHSHTEGSNNTTNAGNSHAEGANNTVNNSKYTAPSGGSSGSTGSTEPSEPADFNIEEHYGEGGHAEGMYNNAYGYASHAEGAHNKSKAHYSHTEGQGNDASGEGAHAEGWSTVASGVHSHSEGQGTKAIGDNAHAEGNGSKATGSGSHAEGSGTAQGDNAHAEGASIANNSNAHAEGLSTTASGNGAHSEGHYTQATNNAAHAEGVHTTANGDGSHTEGWYTTAKNRAEHAEGFFNFSNSVSPSYYTEGNNTLHSVGIGTSASDRKNALEIMQNGDIYAYGVGGYDGTNAVNNASKTLKTVIESKQDKLVSGTNIKTVNGQSLLGSGDITVSGGKKSVTIAIDNLLDTESFTLTADQAAAFADPDTDIMIESYNGMILPLHIYYMQPGDTTKVYARTYDGDILGVTGQGTDILMFMIDGTTLTIQNAILPYKLVLSTTQSNVALSDGGDTLFTKLSTCDIHDITIDVGGLGFVYLPVLYRGKATDDEYTFVYHNYLDSTAGYAYHAIVMTKTSDNVTFEVTTVTNSLTDTEIANIWDSVS